MQEATDAELTKEYMKWTKADLIAFILKLTTENTQKYTPENTQKYAHDVNLLFDNLPARVVAVDTV